MSQPFRWSQSLETWIEESARALAWGEGFDPTVRLGHPRFADFQCNGIISYAKASEKDPHQLAEALLGQLRARVAPDLAGVEVSLARPGFLNFRLKAQALKEWLCVWESREDIEKHHLGDSPSRVVVDYPSPNAAKRLHIGHLRALVIGESLARLQALTGATVIGDDHLGDWGTNFGTLMMMMKRVGFTPHATDPAALADIEELYREGTNLEQQDPAFRDQSRRELKKLQARDKDNLKLWEAIVAISTESFDRLYQRLNVHPKYRLKESFYHDKLERVYRELLDTGLAKEDQGALLVFHPDHPRFSRQALMIRKSDGASNYAAIDLATVLYRVEHFKATCIIYITDSRQKDHFQQVFLTVEKWFRAKNYPFPRLRHITFGTILGKDGKAIKTRSGKPLELEAVLDEAQTRALAVVSGKHPNESEESLKDIAKPVGLAAVRYADLSQHRHLDYVFDLDRFVSLEGDTAPYLLYAVARIRSLLRKVEADKLLASSSLALPSTAEELALARKLLGFPDVLQSATDHLTPHLICNYLRELATLFNRFYTQNKVLDAPRGSAAFRCVLATRVLVVLELFLDLLGIQAPPKM